ncbi:MAG: hypothetical protein IJ391_07300 [Clostridia bacterium]|nr:hypothetical protein [Clostridia bacterium]
MELQKKQMAQAAVLYYEKKYTQQEIAKIMDLSRQTVSKLLNDAVRENIVEIKIHDPENYCTELSEKMCDVFGLKDALVCGVSNTNASLRQLMTVKTAAKYILPIIEKGGKNIALSWGRTIRALIDELPKNVGTDNIVFPLFGATDQVEANYLSNELARGFADKIGAKVSYAWFPYRPDSADDCELFKRTSYYKTINKLWNNIDTAIVGIGNIAVLESFENIFGYNKKRASAIGDISTHFFTADGKIMSLYENTLCATEQNLRNAGQTIAVACGDDKVQAIVGALRTGIIDTIITDEYTARLVLDRVKMI